MPCLCLLCFSRQNNFMRFTCSLIFNIHAKSLRSNFGFGVSKSSFMKLGLNFITFLKICSSYVKTDEQKLVRSYFGPVKATGMRISCIGGKPETINICNKFISLKNQSYIICGRTRTITLTFRHRASSI